VIVENYGDMPYIRLMSTTAHRTARIEARLAPETLDIVRHAARMEGRSVSDFVASAAYNAAVERIDRHDAVQARLRMRRQWSDPTALEQSYAAMAADSQHEAEANEWIEGLIGDIDPGDFKPND
jgi:uncharacterized protein (DUF1778 family)